MSTTEILDRKLNEAILAGNILQAFDTYYADDVVMQENTAPPTIGKAANRSREEEFVASVAEFHRADVKAAAINDDVSISEWEMDISFQGGVRKSIQQAVVRRWKDGLVVAERFYYDTAS